MRVVIIGASSGLGRCIGVALGQQGEQVALMARRVERLQSAAAEAGPDAIAIGCDVTDQTAAKAALDEAAERLGGIDAVVYTPAIGPLVPLTDIDGDTWRNAFDTNVTGAALVAAAALPHLRESNGRAVFLSSVISSMTPPWPGMATYAVTKAALDKLVEAWRAEHPDVGFTRLTVGDCPGGEGENRTEFNQGWDLELAQKYYPVWLQRGYMGVGFIDVDHLIEVVNSVLRAGPSVDLPVVIATPRAAKPTD